MHAPAPDDRADWQRARRAVARRYHPDLGGDLDTYLRKVRAVDHAYGHQVRTRGPGVVVTSAGALARLRRARHRGVRTSRRMVRSVRAHLPRGVPGRRRYTSV